MTKPKSFSYQKAANKNPLAAAKDVKPFRDIHVKSNSVACPVCKSEVGVRCVSSTGRTQAKAHPRRRRLAYEKNLTDRQNL